MQTCPSKLPSAADAPLPETVTRHPGKAEKWAGRLTALVFSRANCEHPAMSRIRNLGLETRTRLLAKRDAAAMSEAGLFGKLRSEANTSDEKSARPIEPPDTELASTPKDYAALLDIMRSGMVVKKLAEFLSSGGLGDRLTGMVSDGLVGPGRPVRSLGEAMVFLSPARTCQLAMLMALFDGLDPAPMARGDALFRHSMATAVLARLLARASDLDHPDDHFLAGLAHDLGRLVLAANRPMVAEKILTQARESREMLFDAEFSVAGYSHPTQAAVLLKSWPVGLVNIQGVLCHHVPEFSSRPRQAAVVHLADIMAHALVPVPSGERFVPPLSGPAWDCLDLAPDDLEDVAREAMDLLAPDTSRAKTAPDAPFDFF